MKRVLPGGWERKGCYPAGHIYFSLWQYYYGTVYRTALKKKKVKFLLYLKLRECRKHEKGATRGLGKERVLPGGVSNILAEQYSSAL